MRKVIFGLVVFLGASLAVAQNVVWTKVVPGTSDAKIAKDGSGNVYLATREATLSKIAAYVSKYSANGDLVYKVKLYERSNTKSIRIEDITADGLQGYLLVERTTGIATAPSEGAEISAFNLTTGARVWAVSKTYDFNRIFAKGTYLVGLATNISADPQTLRGHFVRLNKQDGSQEADKAFGSVPTEFWGGSQDDTSLVYAFGVRHGTTNGALAVSYTEYGTQRWFHTVSIDLLTGTYCKYGAAVSQTGHCYMQVYGTLTSNGEYRTYVTSLAISNGTEEHTTIQGSNNPNEPADFIADQSAVYSMIDVTGQYTTIVNVYDPNLEGLYTTFSGGPAGGNKKLTLNPAGNVLIAAPTGPSSERDISLWCQTPILNDLVVWNSSYSAPGYQEPTGVLCDGAGNALLVGNSGPDVFLAKIAPAFLFFNDDVVTGGTAITASIQHTSYNNPGDTFTLASSNPSVASVPATATVPFLGTSVDFTINTVPVASNTNVSINAKFKGIVLQKTVTVAAPLISAVLVSPNSVFGGQTSGATVTLTGKTATGGKVVTLSSSLTSAATVPASITVPAGAQSKNFTVTTFPVSANKGVVISATTGAVTKTAFMAVNAAWMTSFTVAPGSVKGGNPATVTAKLNGKAPTGGTSIQLVSGAPGLVVMPSSLAVPSGTTQKSQGITTHAVTTSTTITLIAYRGPYVITTSIVLTP